MSRDELLRMLDLGGAARDPATSTLDVEDATARQEDAGPVSSTALKLDEWDLTRGAKALADSPKMQSHQTTPEAAADFFGAAFKVEPELAGACEDPRRHDFLKAMLESPEYQALHSSTCLSELSSEIAANAFAEQYGELVKDDEKRQQRPGRKGQDPQLAADMAALRAAGKAVEQAAGEVEEVEEAQRAFGLGDGTGGAVDAKRIAALYRTVRHDRQLKRIVDLAGRFRRLAQAKQRQKQTHGYDDMIGVELSGDVGRLVPAELALLADEDLGDDALRRLAERQMMSRQFRGVERVARGPVIVCVDESGSMSGSRIESAKAFALAMAWVARQQGRWCALNGWSGHGQSRTIALPPGRWDEVAVLQWCQSFWDGGTEPPLDAMPAIYAETKASAGKTDVVIVTDGDCTIEPETVARFNAWKKQSKARLITLVIGAGEGDMPKVSDEVFKTGGIDVDDAAVGRCLSI